MNSTTSEPDAAAVKRALDEVEEFIRNKRRLTSHIERQQRRKTVAAK